MTRPSPVLTTAVLAGLITLAGCSGQSPAPVPADAQQIEQVPAPVAEPEAPAATASVEAITLGTSVGQDRSIPEPATRFSSDAGTLYAAVVLTSSQPDTPTQGTLQARWSFQDGQLVDERSEAFDFTGQDTINFRVRHQDGWPAGDYTLATEIDGQPAQRVTFTIE